MQKKNAVLIFSFGAGSLEWSLWCWEKTLCVFTDTKGKKNKDRWNMKLRPGAWDSGPCQAQKRENQQAEVLAACSSATFSSFPSRKFQSFPPNMHRACITATVMDKAMKTPYALAFHSVYPVSSGTWSLCESQTCPNNTHCSVLFIIFHSGSILRKTALAFGFRLQPASPCLNAS